MCGMTERGAMRLVNLLRRLEALSHDLAQEIQRDGARDRPATRDIVEQIAEIAGVVRKTIGT
jgi:hypothetical protein